MTKIHKKKFTLRTDEGRDDEDNVKSQAYTSSSKEVGNRTDRDDDGCNGYGDKQLERQDGIYFPYESPPKLRTLQHHRVQRPRAALDVGLRELLRPHL